MTLILADSGAAAMLDAAVAGLVFTCRLFRNDLLPDKGTLLAQLEEADFSGYLPVVITADGPVGVVGHVATQAFTDAVFAHDGGAGANLVYGYYVTEAGGALCWVERDPQGPRALVGVPDAYRIRPRFDWSSKYPDPCPAPGPSLVAEGGGAGDGDADFLFVAAPASSFLEETGDALLLETGDHLLLEI